MAADSRTSCDDSVCDLDQAIFEFRHGTPSNLREFAGKYRHEDRLRLTGNFRSSAPICALAATFRNRQEPDTPLGETANITHPVILATYSGRAVPSKIGGLFVQRLEYRTVGLFRADAIVLAHQLRDAQRATGDPMSLEVSGASRIEALARAVSEFWSPSITSRSRDSALRVIEKLLLCLMGYWQGEDHHPSRVIERAGLNRREVRRQAIELVMRIPKMCQDTEHGRTNWIASVHSVVSCLQLVRPQGTTVRGFFRTSSQR